MGHGVQTQRRTPVSTTAAVCAIPTNAHPSLRDGEGTTC
jgi:hypothetical protein